MVNTGPAGLEKPREKPVAAGRLENFDPPSALESPLFEAISWRRSAVRGRAAKLTHEHRRCVGHARDGDGDVIEENSGHGRSILAKLAHAGKVARRGTMAESMEERFQTLQEIVKAARQNLAPGPWDYLIEIGRAHV